MLQIYQRSVPGTYRARGCLWEARCEIGGQAHSAQGRSGAANELARQLVAIGIPDQPVEVYQDGLKGHMAYRSLHEMAKWTYSEGDRRLSRAPYRQMPVLRDSMASNRGGQDDDG